MDKEDLVLKSHGTCGILETTKERLQKWDKAITERYTNLEKFKSKRNIKIEWSREEDKCTIKINKVGPTGEKSREKQTHTITLYRGENARKFMIQSKEICNWKTWEFQNIKDLVDGKKSYAQIVWNEKWLDISPKLISEDLLVQQTPEKASESLIEINTPKISKERKKEILIKAEKSLQKLNKAKEIEQEKIYSMLEALENEIMKLQNENKYLNAELHSVKTKIQEYEKSFKNDNRNPDIKTKEIEIKLLAEKVDEMHQNIVKIDKKMDTAVLQPENITKINGELLIFREEIDKLIKENHKSFKQFTDKSNDSQNQASEYLNTKFDMLNVSTKKEFHRFDTSMANLSKEIEDLRQTFSERSNLEICPPSTAAYVNPSEKPNQESNLNDTSMSRDTKDDSDEECDILLIGDSIIKGVYPAKFFPTKITISQCFRGGKIKDLTNYFSSSDLTIKERIIIHVGSNDIAQAVNINEMLQEMENLISSIKTKYSNVEVAISMILPRLNNFEFDFKYKKMNQGLRKMARENNIRYINHFDIEGNRGAFVYDGIHLSNLGTKILVREIKDVILQRKQPHAKRQPQHERQIYHPHQAQQTPKRTEEFQQQQQQQTQFRQQQHHPLFLQQLQPQIPIQPQPQFEPVPQQQPLQQWQQQIWPVTMQQPQQPNHTYERADPKSFQIGDYQPVHGHRW